MTVDVTIISLIYRSPEYAKGLYERLQQVTPSIKNGTTKFYFVANNANRATRIALEKNKIPHFVFNSPELSDLEHFDLGFAKPAYIGKVYAGYNYGIQKCESKFVVLINSDMVFGPNWLEELLAYEDGSSIVSCTLVEREHPKFGIFPGAIEGSFGSSFRNLKWSSWVDFCHSLSDQARGYSNGGAYMPALFQTKWFTDISLYPEGNIRSETGTYSDVSQYGDEFLFSKLEEMGIRHITSPKSFCYHFKEGERATEFIPKLQNYLAILKKIIRKTIKR